MLERAAKDWAAIPDSSLAFQSLGIVDGASAGKDGRNTISMADDLFADQKFIAMTTNWYDDNGRIIEADMQIDPTAVSGGYNLQQLVDHEMGHVLGLDHSAVLSSVMYPYIGNGNTVALDSDDRVAISTAYSKTKPASGATLEGRVYSDEGGIFAAQVVAENDEGRAGGDRALRQERQLLPAGRPQRARTASTPSRSTVPSTCRISPASGRARR